jgi:hypothetical protein
MNTHFCTLTMGSLRYLLIVLMAHGPLIAAAEEKSDSPNGKWWADVRHVKESAAFVTLQQRAAPLSKDAAVKALQVNSAIHVGLDTPMEAAQLLSDRAFQAVAGQPSQEVDSEILKNAVGAYIDLRVAPQVRKEAVGLLKADEQRGMEALIGRTRQKAPPRPEPPSPVIRPATEKAPPASSPWPRVTIPSLFENLTKGAEHCPSK